MNEPFTSYFIGGLASFVVGVPLLRGWIPRNRWAGFRAPKTLSSDRIWYKANWVAGRNLIIAGAVIMATAGASSFAQQIPGLPFEKIIKIVVCGALFIAVLHSFIALRRM